MLCRKVNSPCWLDCVLWRAHGRIAMSLDQWEGGESLLIYHTNRPPNAPENWWDVTFQKICGSQSLWTLTLELWLFTKAERQRERAKVARFPQQSVKITTCKKSDILGTKEKSFKSDSHFDDIKVSHKIYALKERDPIKKMARTSIMLVRSSEYINRRKWERAGQLEKSIESCQPSCLISH